MPGNREAIIERVTAIAERIAAREGMEIAQVELVGGGRNRVLRIFIDRPPAPGESVPIDQPFGVTLGDCEMMSDKVGEALDLEDVIPGEGYQLEVSSPGVERKLSRPVDFERFRGHKVKIRLREPLENQKVWRGTLGGVIEGGAVSLSATAPQKMALTIPLEQIERANVEFQR